MESTRSTAGPSPEGRILAARRLVRVSSALHDRASPVSDRECDAPASASTTFRPNAKPHASPRLAPRPTQPRNALCSPINTKFETDAFIPKNRRPSLVVTSSDFGETMRSGFIM